MHLFSFYGWDLIDKSTAPTGLFTESFIQAIFYLVNVITFYVAKTERTFREFMKQIDFTSLPFEQALRHFISKLRLPVSNVLKDLIIKIVFSSNHSDCRFKHASCYSSTRMYKCKTQ